MPTLVPTLTSALCIVIAVCGGSGCAASGDTRPARDTRPTAHEGSSSSVATTSSPGNNRTPSQVSSDPLRSTVAIVDGQPLRGVDLHAHLVELAGAEALAELVLDQRLRRLIEQRDVQVTRSMIERERELVSGSLSDDPQEAGRLWQEVRRRQGLGPVRTEALLQRNAMLRALVSSQVEINEAAVQQMHTLHHGPRREARIIVTSTLSDAQSVIRALDSGTSFAAAALNWSTDPSAARGGLLEPISEADPSYPRAFRSALFTLTPGGRSNPTLIEDSYIIIHLERELPGSDVPLAEVRPEMTRLARLNQERLLMQQLAEQLLREARVTIFDEALHRAWTESRGD